jgi:hypothetical protein
MSSATFPVTRRPSLQLPLPRILYAVPTLVIMAAGLGSRYGGAKQIDAVGPSGEMLLDYAVFDARRAGFTRIVFVVRDELAARIDAHARRFPADLEMRSVVQDEDRSTAARPRPSGARPWGTVHAALAARSVADPPFVVLNGDDFYGPTAYAIAKRALDDAEGGQRAAVIGMRLVSTLSKHGPVTRAICETAAGCLTCIEEVQRIERREDGIVGLDRSGAVRRLSGDEVVSMNMWMLSATAIERLAERFGHFFRLRGDDPDAELPLPEAVGELVAEDALQVQVHEAPGPWFGLTHGQDRSHVVAALRALVDQGVYPEALWRH